MNISQILRTEPGTDRELLQKRYLGMLESCRMVAGFAESPEVRDIAQKKLEQLREAGRQAGLSEEVQLEGGGWEPNLNTIRLALNSSHSDVKQLEHIEIQLNSLPKSAENYYLRAVVRLKMQSDMSSLLYVTDNLKKSLELDPGFLASRKLLNVVEEQQKKHEEEQRQLLEQKEQERQEQERERQKQEKERQELERQRQKELRRQKYEEMLDNVGATVGACCYCCCGCCGELMCKPCDC